MSTPTKHMRREYKAIAKSAAFKWYENASARESYLYLAGHRIARVGVDRHNARGFEARCPGDLIACRRSLDAAKRAAVDAVLSWLEQASLNAHPYPEQA